MNFQKKKFKGLKVLYIFTEIYEMQCNNGYLRIISPRLQFALFFSTSTMKRKGSMHVMEKTLLQCTILKSLKYEIFHAVIKL